MVIGKSMKIVHVITGLNIGGAEVTMIKLIKQLHNENTHFVINLNKPGVLNRELNALNVEVFNLCINPVLPNPIKMLSLISHLKKIQPDIIQTWMVHADFIGGVAGKVIGVPVVWNLRHTKVNSSSKAYKTRLLVIVCALLSKIIPSLIISNSKSGKQFHVEKGYSLEKIEVIPNGFDVDLFKPDVSSREKMRGELGIRSDITVIGLIGRYNELKDHDNFIQAASLIDKKDKNIKYLLCGKDINLKNVELMKTISNSGLIKKFIILEQRNDIPEIMNALDVLVSSSKSEGFPNTVGEAMSCGIPCVVTDVGDSAFLIEKAGIVVPAEDPESLAQGCINLLSMTSENKIKLKEYARERILEYFNIRDIALKYYSLYKRVVEN